MAYNCVFNNGNIITTVIAIILHVNKEKRNYPLRCIKGR